jgi:hypothetical protein
MGAHTPMVSLIQDMEFSKVFAGTLRPYGPIFAHSPLKTKMGRSCAPFRDPRLGYCSTGPKPDQQLRRNQHGCC